MPRRSALDWFLDAGIWLLFAVLLIPAIVLGFALGRSEKQQTKTVVQTPAMAAKALIEPAPAFSTGDLAATPGDDWITNGGSISNQRYSSLDEIDTSNVSQLKGVWLTHLRGSGIAAKYSAESQPVEYNGIIYVPTGQDDVFAVSADTGEILWEHKANLDQTISRRLLRLGEPRRRARRRARSTSDSSTASSSRSTSGPGRSPGRRRWHAGRTATRSRVHRCTSTGS